MRTKWRTFCDLLPEILAVGFLPLVAIGCLVPFILIR